VRKVLNHYEEQTKDEATAEDEAAFEDRNQTFRGDPERPAARSPIADRQTPNTGLRFGQGRHMLRPE
jgi:hypothetical protein